jgi:hypothetical protein
MDRALTMISERLAFARCPRHTTIGHGPIFAHAAVTAR